MKKIEVNVETGEVTEIIMTEAEITHWESETAKEEAQKQTKIDAKTALLAKLGIDESEAALLLS
jgi:hypothetical protein